MYYQKNRLKAQTKNTLPTLTDQAAARSTDINVIVGQFNIGGQAPGNAMKPIAGDFSEIPQGLREMMDAARTMKGVRERLPEQLRSYSLEQLLALTPQDIKRILTPVDPTQVKDTKT